MKSYETYLQQQDYAKGTITSYLRTQFLFTTWCESNNFEIDTIDYKGCLSYVQLMQKPKKGKRLSKKTINHQVGALKIYFNYLIDENYRMDNPFHNINIRGIKRTVNHNLLEYEELEDLFYSYQTRNIQLPCLPHVAIRNKVIIGLMVYQGLNATSLQILEMEHIDLNKGYVYVPSTRITDARKLTLEPQQILSMVEYIQTARPIIQEVTNCYSEAFIPSSGKRYAISESLFKKLKRINHKVKDAKQIRASVITHWLQHYNIREVQYMAGHRYISSTERYVQDNLENLHEIIETLHPITF